MFKWLRRRKSSRLENILAQVERDTKDIPEIPLPKSFDDKMALLRPYIEKNHDLVARSFYLDREMKAPACAVYFSNVIDDKKLNEHILKPLMLHSGGWKTSDFKNTRRLDRIILTSIFLGKVSKSDNFAAMVHSLFDGMLVLIFDGIQQAVIIDIHGGQLRAIQEPPAERAIRGPREGFIENLDINIAMIRRHLRTPRLVIKKTTVGKRTRTPVGLVYIDDIVDRNVLAKVNELLDSIDTDGVLNAGAISQMIDTNPFSPFPSTWTSERPDKCIAQLLEGRVALLIDGTPTAVFFPTLFVEFFQGVEEYQERTYVGSYLRLLLYIAFFIAISFPALYVALSSFTPELLPVNLLVSLAQARKEVPFPVLVEILVQEFIIQTVIESGLRLPGPVGQTAGVVAGVILGQAAISAKLATPAVIIIIAITTISTYSLPAGPLVQATRILRLPLIILTAIFGLYGFSLGWLLMLAHLCSLETFGVPYFSPFAPMRFADLKDSLVRVWLWKMNKRPLSIPSQQKKRQRTTGKVAGEKSE